MFLGFMLLATQLLAVLYATTVLTSAAHDAAELVARTPGTERDAAADLAAQGTATEALRTRLGDAGSRAAVDWSASDAHQVVLTASIPSPTVVPGVLRGGEEGDRIERTVHVRRERWR